jgi:hypothetical protein
MTIVELTKEKPSSGEIGRYPNRYMDFNIKKGTVEIKFTKANDESEIYPYFENTAKKKKDIIAYVKFEFLSNNDAIIEYKLYPEII